MNNAQYNYKKAMSPLIYLITVVLNGRKLLVVTGSSNWVTAMEVFQNECCILLTTYAKSGIGLNLTKATKVYLLNPTWNPQVC